MNTVKQMFHLDLRSLALFRMGLALLVLIDLYLRALDLHIFYTDEGILPIANISEYTRNVSVFSIHAWNGSFGYQAFLFIIHALAALFLFFGYRTKIALFVVGVLLYSLQARNPLLHYGADAMMRMLILWSVFLPLGARFSIDAALCKGEKIKENSYFHWTNLGYFLQLGLLYFYSGYLKDGPAWQDGTAVYYALNITTYAKPLASYMLNYDGLMAFFTHATLVLEMYFPFLFLVPVYTNITRSILVISFISFHFGLNIVLAVGLFPWVGIVAWLALLPTSFWKKVSKPSTAFTESTLLYRNGSHEKALRLFLGFFSIQKIVLKQDATLKQTFVLVKESKEFANKEAIRESMQNASFGIFRWKWVATFFVSLGKIISPILILKTKALSFNTLNFKPYAFSVYICSALMALILFASLERSKSVDLPDNVDRLLIYTQLEQRWGLFKGPSTRHGWFAVCITRKDDTVFEVITGKENPNIREAPAAVISNLYPTSRWQKFISSFRKKAWKPILYNYLQYVAKDYNSKISDESKKAKSITFFYVPLVTAPNKVLQQYKPYFLLDINLENSTFLYNDEYYGQYGDKRIEDE